MTDRSVVVTGLGPVTSIGVGAKEFHLAQLDGRRGVRTVTHFDATGLPVRIAGEIDFPPDLAPDSQESVRLDRCSQMALAAARLAIEDSGLDLEAEDPTRIGISVGTGIGGIRTWEATSQVVHSRGVSHVSPRMIPMAMANNPASSIAIRYDLCGPSATAAIACASGSEALVVGYQMIIAGEADVVIAGGTEAPITPVILTGFARLRALSQRNDDPEHASRPFSADRDGFVLAEGAGMLVLESASHAAARGATAIAEFAGYGRSSDAFHITRPQPGGDGARRALQAAMRSAGLPAEKVSYINAHGTGTKFNDETEVAAVRTALGQWAERTPISSTKSLTGHPIGAAGAIEAVATVQAIQSGVIPPTVNLTVPDAELGLDFVPDEPREAPVDFALSNSFGFGGHNVVLAFTRA